MFSRRNVFYSILLIICCTILNGCLIQKSVEENMYEIMEKVVLAEETFEKQQDPLVQAEKQEKQIYDKIISLGMKEHDEIINLADEAIKLVEERKTLMAIEKESMGNSKSQFKSLLPLIDKIDEPSTKKDAKKIYDVMLNRYGIHEELIQAYSIGLELDGELYELFKNKNLSMEQLENQINKINDIYSNIYKLNDKFNDYTEDYNRLKLDFYQKAGFKIEE